MGAPLDELRSLRDLAERGMAALEERLATMKREIGDYQLFLVGSLRTGLYCGPKPAWLSLNESCPFERVNELDLRILVGSDRDPHKLAASIAVAFGTGATIELTRVDHWDRVGVPSALLYRYEAIDADVGLEWEADDLAAPTRGRDEILVGALHAR